MSSVIVSFGISFQSADKIYEGNKQFLFDSFSKITGIIGKMLEKIPEAERSELMQEYLEIKNFCAEQLEHYTKESISAFSSKIVIAMFDKLNQNALRLKKLIMLKEAEIFKQNKRCEKLKNSIEALAFTLPAGEQEHLRKTLSEIESLSHDELENKLRKIAAKLSRVAETAQVTENEIPVQEALKHIQKPGADVLAQIESFIADMMLADIPVTEEILHLSETAHKSKLQSKQVLFFEQIKLTAAQLQEERIMTALYREELLQIAALSEVLDLSSLLSEEISILTAQETITESEYRKISLKIAESFARKMAEEHQAIYKDTAAKIEAGLEELGYSVIDNESLSSGDPVFFNTDNPDCKIMAKMNDHGEFAARVVYESDDESESYAQEKSREAAKKWCRDYDRLVEKLRKSGVRLETIVRKEPEETPVTVIKKKQKHDTKKKNQTNTARTGI